MLYIGDPHPIDTPGNYKLSSLPPSPMNLGKQANIQYHHVVDNESHSCKEIERCAVDQHRLECQDIGYRGISFRNVKMAFDEKYGVQGRFETTMPSQPDAREPTKHSSNDEGIPRLGLVAGDGEPSDTEDSEGMYY